MIVGILGLILAIMVLAGASLGALKVLATIMLVLEVLCLIVKVVFS